MTRQNCKKILTQKIKRRMFFNKSIECEGSISEGSIMSYKSLFNINDIEFDNEDTVSGEILLSGCY